MTSCVYRQLLEVAQAPQIGVPLRLAELKTNHLILPAQCALLPAAELLDVYRAALVAVQRRVAAGGGFMPLSGLYHALAEFRSLLPPLHQLLHTVMARGMTGTPLLHLLHAKVPHVGVDVGQGLKWGNCQGRGLNGPEGRG